MWRTAYPPVYPGPVHRTRWNARQLAELEIRLEEKLGPPPSAAELERMRRRRKTEARILARFHGTEEEGRLW